eukprot:4475429-Heterocapsa_arctica.AAC.1
MRKQIDEKRNHMERVGAEANKEGASEEERRRLIQEWQQDSKDQWKLLEDKKRMDIKHHQQEKDLREAFAVNPDQSTDVELDRQHALLRKQTEDEAA